MSDARRLCEQFGIKIVKGSPGDELETASINVIERLIKLHGVGTMTMTLRIFVETHPANLHQLSRVCVTAVNAVCRLRHYTDRGLAFLEAFDHIDIGALHQRAESFRLQHPVWATLATLVIDELRAALPEKSARPAKPVGAPLMRVLGAAV
jgi:hypothetical protein